MAIESDDSLFPQDVAGLLGLEKIREAFEVDRPFDKSSPGEILARFERRSVRTQAELLALLGRLGLTPLQALVIMDAFDEHHKGMEAFLRVGLGQNESREGPQHPLAEAYSYTISEATERLQMQLGDDDRERFLEKTLDS